MKKGLDASYDVFGGNTEKLEKLNDPDFVSAHRMAPFFAKLKAEQSKHINENDLE